MAASMNPEGVIFDLDGTLIASETVYREAWRLAARELDIELTDELYVRLIGLNRDDTIARLAEIWPRHSAAERFVDRSQVHYDAIVARQGHALRPGVQGLLGHLSRQKTPMAVATSSARQLAVDTLAATKLAQFFSVLVGGDEITFGKPHPEIYLTAATRLGCDPRKCVAFEDSVAGATAALHAGLTVVFIPELPCAAHSQLTTVIRLNDHAAAIELFPVE